MHFSGVLIGLFSFLIIGLFHPIVIKCEYRWGTKIWPLFLSVGLLSIVVSLFVANPVGSALLGLLGFASLWSIRELFEQKKRVEKGWFPKNPKRQ